MSYLAISPATRRQVTGVDYPHGSVIFDPQPPERYESAVIHAPRDIFGPNQPRGVFPPMRPTRREQPGRGKRSRQAPVFTSHLVEP